MNELEELLKKLISQNYYERLGLPKYASVEQIKAKSREIARIMAQYHPDKATDPDQRKIFNEIFSLYSEARQGLQSEEQKRRYDARLRYEDINSTQSKTVYQKTKTTYTQSTSSGQTSGATSSQTSKQAEPAPGPERKTEEKAPNTKEEAPKSEEKTKVSTTEEEEKEEVKKETTFKGTTTSQSSGQEEKISVKAPEISIKKTYYPTSRALIAQRIIKDIKFTDPNLVIAHAILLINATERETIWGQTILEPLKKPVREIDPEGRPEIQKRLDEEYKQALDLYKRKLEHQYDLAVYAIKIIAAEEKEGIKVISRENTEGEDKTEDSEGTGKTEEGKEPSGPTKPSTSQGEGEYYIDFTGSRVLHIRPRSGFNQKDAAIVTHNPGWQFSSGTTLVATQERVDYYVVPKEYVQGTEHPLVLAGLVTPAGVITASKLLEDRQKRIQETTKYLIDSIAAGEQGEDLQNRLNSDPEGTYKEISKFVEAEQLFHFSQIYPSAANYLADKYPEIAKAIKARNFVNQRLLKEGLVDPKNPLPYDPNVDAYTGTYEITRVAWERYGESNSYKIPSNEQLAQSSLYARASSIIDFVDKNSELLEKIPQVKNLYEKAAKIKGILPDATKKLGQEAVKKGAEALARGTTTQLAKSALAKGIASLLAKAGAAIASGGISLLISFIPEIINFLRNPGKYLKKLGEFIGASILALAGLLTTLIMAITLQIVILFIAAMLGMVGIVAFVLLVINTSGFVIPEAEELTLQRNTPNQSENILISKSSSAGDRIENPTGQREIEYTITITARANLSDIAFNNSYTISQSQNQAPAILSPLITIPSTIANGSIYQQTYSISIDNRYADALICDTFTLSATVNGSQRETVSDTYCISVGNSPRIADCSGPTPNQIPTATGILRSNNGRYAFPVAPYQGTTEGTRNGACVHWDGFRSTDIFPAGVSSTQSLPARAAVLAYTDGEVIWAREDDPIGGKNIAIRGDDGGYFYYAHLCHIFVSRNQRVSAGQVIGTTDRTGSAGLPGSPEHLHFAINRGQFFRGCFPGGDGDTCPATDFNNNIEGYNRCERPEQQCPGMRIHNPALCR